jgi:hypothetical protein
MASSSFHKKKEHGAAPGPVSMAAKTAPKPELHAKCECGNTPQAAFNDSLLTN